MRLWLLPWLVEIASLPTMDDLVASAAQELPIRVSCLFLALAIEEEQQYEIRFCEDL